MKTLSLAMIVKNEEKVLDRCLDSCKGVFDEIIIVDTGSTDSTKQIAKNYTNKVFDFEWKNDFSLARNFAFSKASTDYVMWLDADDVMPSKTVKQLKKLKQNLAKTNFDVVMLKYDISFDSAGKPNFSYYRERIVKNDGSFFWQDPVHEVISPHGKICYLDASIEHRKIAQTKKSNRNLKIYESLRKQGVIFSERQMYYYARELMFNQKYSRAIKEFSKFLKMPNIWSENAISACKDMSDCFLAIGDRKSAKYSLLMSLLFGLPKAEICCKLGDLLMQENDYETAIFWFENALKSSPNLKSGAFVEREYYEIYPCLQLCVCYYKLGDIAKSKHYNSRAEKFDKNNISVQSNKKFFAELDRKSPNSKK